jgi:NAD(P)-dependent dehydrogenase (short-subunit alcohol dehydrogenase family)
LGAGLGKLNGQVVLVTGGTGGFGKAMAGRFLEEKARVIITGRTEKRLADACADLVGADGLRADAGSSADWERVAEHVGRVYGRLDILVNNAGGGIRVTDTVDQSISDIDEILRVNLAGVIYGCRTFGKVMKARGGGTIINVSSACAHHAWPQFSVYAAAKAGVVSFSKGLYAELRPYHVRVTALEPGAGSTGFSKNAGLAEPPVPFALKAAHLAEAVIHICSLPMEIWVEEYRIWGQDQEVIPL